MDNLPRTKDRHVVITRRERAAANRGNPERRTEMSICDTLKSRTCIHWEKRDYERYVQELLGDELACAEEMPSDDGFPRLQRLEESVHTLALTVGDSLEPLLQVICVLKPQRVVLILNKRYSNQTGKARGLMLKRLISKLATVQNLPSDLRPAIAQQDIQCHVLDVDTPTQVFRALQSAFRQPEMRPPEGDTNAVDITGAKKSMVVGAFLYAAHSDLPITYVDFDSDQYDATWGRPYGYACKIRPITNPYEAFGLRDWERVRQLYERYDFRGARALLGKLPEGDQPGAGILRTMSGHLEAQTSGRPLYDESDIARVQELENALRMYEAWDSGDFGAAATTQTVIPNSQLPDAIGKLGQGWFRVHGAGITGGPPDFYANLKALKVYAVDELKRIVRLIDYNQDYRSAFQRAGGLNEVLMTARFVRLVDGQDQRILLEALSVGVTPAARKLFEFLAASEIRSASKLVPTWALEGAGREDLSAWAKQTSVASIGMHKWWMSPSYSKYGTTFCQNVGWDAFLQLRNVLAHRYVSVPEDLARDAVRFVQANIEDFLGEVVDDMRIRTEAIRWPELCSLCQLDFLPPRLCDVSFKEAM